MLARQGRCGLAALSEGSPVSAGELLDRLEASGCRHIVAALPEVLLGALDRPIHTTVYQRLTEGAVRGWSSNYRNAYATYQTEAGQNIFLWYENERSIEEKVGVARLLGVTGVSVWRLGLIPSYADEGLSYDAMRAIS